MFARQFRLAATILCLSFPAAAHAMPEGMRGPGASEGMAAAFDAMRGGSYLDALEAAERAGPVARDVIEWLRLREGRGDFDETLAFLRRNPDWPGLGTIRIRGETEIPRPRNTTQAEDVVAFFSGGDPATGQGVVALVEAFRMLGRDGDGRAQAALAWVTRTLAEGAERDLLAIYPDDLAALDGERMEAMFWRGATPALRRAVERAPDLPEAATAKMRLAARPTATDGEAPLDAGVAHLRFERLVTRDREAAADLMLAQSDEAAHLGHPQAWARERRDLARRLMQAGDTEKAYRLASSHWLTEGADLAELEWLAGYLSLRFREEPQTALLHFERFRDAVSTPISLGRAGYWIGRAYDEMDQTDLADDAYRFGARYQTSFYGLLAAEAAGVPLDPSLSGTETFPHFAQTDLRESTVLEAALLLQAAGERDLAERFFTHLSESLERDEVGALGDLLLSLGEPHIAVRIAKRVAQDGMTVPKAYYPVVDLGVDDMPVSPALALAIARRESEFDPGVASGVGARGLMQLMPGTAQEVARSLDLAYSPTRLFSDPSYNATLGTAYLAGLIRRFGDNPILVSAGYNAGPGRPLAWMRERGDPRSGDVDVIDWIEQIPFDETRNYVMRVAESLPVYRARLTGETGPVTLSRELSGR